jgi:hypothetical protein
MLVPTNWGGTAVSTRPQREGGFFCILFQGVPSRLIKGDDTQRILTVLMGSSTSKMRSEEARMK